MVDAREGIKSKCLAEVRVNATLQNKTEDGGVSIAEIVKNISCINECLGRGKCSNGTFIIFFLIFLKSFSTYICCQQVLYKIHIMIYKKVKRSQTTSWLLEVSVTMEKKIKNDTEEAQILLRYKQAYNIL